MGFVGDQEVAWTPLQAQALDIRKYATNEIQGQLDKIQSLRNKCTWEGADGEESLQGFDNFMKEMSKLPTALTKYADFLDRVAGTYAETSSAVRSTFSNDIYKVG